MTVSDVVRELDSFDKGSTIYAAEPWTESSLAVVTVEPDTGGVPAEARRLGLKYFLEVFIATDVLDGWAEHLKAQPTVEEKCARLIQYAINDA